MQKSLCGGFNETKFHLMANEGRTLKSPEETEYSRSSNEKGTMSLIQKSERSRDADCSSQALAVSAVTCPSC